MSTDVAKMKIEIEKWEGKDGFERYLAFLQEAHRHYELSMAHVMRKNFTSLLSLLRPAVVRNILKLHIIESVYTRASKYFLTERLRRVFTFASMYMGMSPFDAFGAYSLLQYTELAEGIWYPLGGFHKVIEGLTNIGERLGVEYRLNTEVSSIQLSADGRTATGVKLPDGQELTADIVICNADLVWAYNNILPPSAYSTSLTKRETSCSSISFYWALDRVVPELKAHNIFLADQYKESFDAIFKDHLIPEEPSFYVNVPSRVDPSAAPANRDTVVVLVPVGHLRDPNALTRKHTRSLSASSPEWPMIREIARRKVLNTIKARLGVDLVPHIVYETFNDPQTWKDNFNLDRGGILGLSHSFFNVLCFRPKTKHQSIDGLYFVGASTHPGTGVPVCLAGAKLVSQQILEDNRIKIPWKEGGLKMENTGLGIDRTAAGHRTYTLAGAALVILGSCLAALWHKGLGIVLVLQRNW
jgi:phytoene desaturase (3,4-didehydrolycopene-forming)